MEQKGTLKKIIIVGGIIILIIMIFLVAFKDNKYKKLETSMLATTKSLVKTNRLSVNSNYFFTLNQMGIKETYDCRKDSGINIKRINNDYTYDVYLICDSYTSQNVANVKSKYIEIIGANPLILKTGTKFVDPGYDSKGYVVENISNIQDFPGVYKVTYYVYNNSKRIEEVNRYVIVNETGSSEAPTITLKGDNNISIKLGDTYIEPGFVATDLSDGVITDKVIVSNNINSNVIGDYEVVYKVTNSKGLTTTIRRIVSVVKEVVNINTSVSIEPNTITKQDVNINLKITGSDYAYTLLPGNKRDYTKNVDFKATNNDKYVFKIYGKNGQFVEKEVLIENIDRTSPKGICQATLSGSILTYNVTASDESGIKGYSYNTGVGYTEYMETNTFKYIMDSSLASVNIQDNAGNITKINCTVSKISDITDVSVPSTITLYVGDSYEIPITLTPSSASKSDISLELLSGQDYVSLSNFTVKGLNVGNAIIKLSVKDSTITKTISVNVKSKSSNLSSPGSTSQDVLAAANKYSDDSTAPGETASWCTKHAGYMQAYYNGRKLSYDELITISVGQTITIKLNLIVSCGKIELLTRTSVGGITGWSEWASASSSPAVNRNNPSTFLKTSTYNWIITGKKSTGNGAVALSQTATIKTDLFNEIKAFYRMRLKIK